MTEPDYFHVGYLTPDLEASMAELSAALPLTWREPVERDVRGMRWRVVYSAGVPPFIELLEGEPGSPWHSASGPTLHHIGCFTYDLDATLATMESLGATIEIDGRELTGRWAYFRLPASGALIEYFEADDETRHAMVVDHAYPQPLPA